MGGGDRGIRVGIDIVDETALGDDDVFDQLHPPVQLDDGFLDGGGGQGAVRIVKHQQISGEFQQKLPGGGILIGYLVVAVCQGIPEAVVVGYHIVRVILLFQYKEPLRCQAGTGIPFFSSHGNAFPVVVIRRE